MNGCSCQGTVYLIHFDEPYKHARHYLGWASPGRGRLERRLEQHRKGTGARLMQVIFDAGIGWQLARTWPGGRDLERRLKQRHKIRTACPLCGVTPRDPPYPPLTETQRPESGTSLRGEPPY